ncbi:uncharacterized protein LOC132543817 [Ylistrum balloti]|uniref:uncharacterized protein LOC132543817 n=1 Tax=Ylistrum balloti TaxID=509963 RepID=UPI002905AEE2|nr:uncharacterized protein LOC132543817 [Ylistrum balloti]
MDQPRVDSDDDDSVMGTEHDPEVVTAILYLKEYAVTKGLSVHSISQMPPEQLADYLKDFYTTVKFKGIEVKDVVSTPVVSLKYLRNGLHRYFQKHYDVDILKDACFEHANKVFDVTSRALPRRCNKFRIEFDDLRKIYMGPGMSLDQPDTLQNKIFFDINLYICNRGKDFLRVMAKDDFVISTDADGRRYVWLKYHPKFSTRELLAMGGVGEQDLTNNGTQIGDKMFERKGDPRCPVTSFLAYLSHLHPMTEAFWQRPKRSFVYDDYVWFDNTPLGNSTLSKIMTRICQSAGLFENFTNHAIKSSYIPIIENLCKMANKKAMHAEFKDSGSVPSPLATCSQGIRDMDDGMTDSGSVCSDAKEPESDEHVLGLQQAKMKVLEMVNGLEVKDIRSFVDWMKTFRAEMDGGGLVVLCSPVGQALQETDSKTTKGNNSSKLSNGSGSQSGSPSSTPPVHRQRETSPAPLSNRRLDVCRSSKDAKQEAADLGIAIKQLDFDCVRETHVSTPEIYPVKVTIPCSDTVLINGLRDSDQILIHNRESAPLMSEAIHSRIFYSEHEMDVAVITALLGTRNSLKKGGQISSVGCEKSENCSKIQDKYKPMKKRSLSDLHADNSREDIEPQPNKKLLIAGSQTTASLPLSRVSANTSSYPPVISNVPVLLSHTARGIGIPQTQRDGRQVSLLPNKIANSIKIKTEPVDK